MLIYFVAPVAYTMGWFVYVAMANGKPIVAMICGIIYFVMHMLAISKYDK